MGGADSGCFQEDEDFVVIDVREKDEYDSGHVDGCLWIPVDTIESRIESEVPDKSKPIKVYCAAGVRAGRAKSKLISMGYTNVKNLGGYSDADRLVKEELARRTTASQQ